MLRNCFLNFAVEHWFGCQATEPGFAGDIGAIWVDWLIDWYASDRLATKTIRQSLISAAVAPFKWQSFKSRVQRRACCCTILTSLSVKGKSRWRNFREVIEGRLKEINKSPYTLNYRPIRRSGFFRSHMQQIKNHSKANLTNQNRYHVVSFRASYISYEETTKTHNLFQSGLLSNEILFLCFFRRLLKVSVTFHDARLIDLTALQTALSTVREEPRPIQIHHGTSYCRGSVIVGGCTIAL